MTKLLFQRKQFVDKWRKSCLARQLVWCLWFQQRAILSLEWKVSGHPTDAFIVLHLACIQVCSQRPLWLLGTCWHFSLPSLQPWNPAQCHTEWHDPKQLDRSYPENLVGRRCLLLCLRAAMDRVWKPLVFNIDADLHETKKWHGRDLNMSWHTHTQRSSTNWACIGTALA